jgi:uncharacterized protein (TIGR03083 family)
MSADTDRVWSLVADQRVQLADALAELSDDDWASPSLCDGWSVHDVLAHLVWLAELDRPRMLRETTVAALRHRCGPLASMTPIARAIAAGSTPPVLLDRLRTARDGRFVVPGAPPTAALAEVLVHGLDMTRPVGRPDMVPPDRARLVVDDMRRFAPVYGVSRRVRSTIEQAGSGWSSGDLLLVAAGRLDPDDVGRSGT